LFNSRGAPEAEALGRGAGHADLDRSQALATDPAAIAQDRAPTFARVPIQKPMLALAADFRGLILSLHNQSINSP
jgi:hypothetical protein